MGGQQEYGPLWSDDLQPSPKAYSTEGVSKCERTLL